MLLISLLLTALIASSAIAQPWTPHIIWDQRGAGEQSHFGSQVYALGDQNGDGYADFAVVSSGTGVPGQINEPRFDLFHGGNPLDTIPYMTFKGRQSPYRELWGAQTIGDMNGDTYTDWWTQYGFGPSDDSIVVEFHWGGATADTIPDFTLSFSGDNGWSWVNPLGDINGDSHADFYFYDGGPELSTDVTYVYFGGSPPDTVPDLIIHSNPIGSQNSLPQASGDINGDRYGDFLTMTNYVQPTSYIYFGGNPPSTVPSQMWPNFDPYPLTMRCDLNHDHKADLVISRSGTQRDYLDVHFGRDTLSPLPDYQLNFPDCENMALFLCSVGDINRDGYDDLVAISEACNLGWGGLRLYLGHPWLNPDPILAIDGREPPLNLVGIRWATGLGDVDGDGVEDWAVGATNDNFDGLRGRVVILSGDSTLRVDAHEPRVEVPRDLRVTVYPNPFNAEATISLDLPGYFPELQVTVFNLLGEVVTQTTLHNVWGPTQYRLDASALSTGLYLLRVTAGDLQATQKLVLLK